MATITVTGTDSAQALDEVLRRLGPNALILSTRSHAGAVEITAAPAGGEAPRPFARLLVQQVAAGLPQRLPSRLVLWGPPGAGTSMLAARLAAHLVQQGGRSQLVAPRAERGQPPGRLEFWARLMGVPLDRPFGGLPAAPAPGVCQIIDLSDLKPAPDTLAQWGGVVWLVLPTGLHPALQDRLCQDLAGRASAIALTRADLCPPTPDDLSLPERHTLPLAVVAQGTGLLDAFNGTDLTC